MDENMIDVLKQGIADELYSADSFTFLARTVTSTTLRVLFISYAKEELKHAEILIGLLSEFIDKDKYQLPKIKAIPFTDSVDFLIQYIAEEEAAVFYYKTLANMTENPTHKKLFLSIQEEEAAHYNKLKKIIEENTNVLIEELTNE